MAVASMVLGIVSIASFFTGLLMGSGYIVGIVGLVLGIVAKKKAPSGMATAGIVCSIIGIALPLVLIIACFVNPEYIVKEIFKSLA